MRDLVTSFHSTVKDVMPPLLCKLLVEGSWSLALWANVILSLMIAGHKKLLNT